MSGWQMSGSLGGEMSGGEVSGSHIDHRRSTKYCMFMLQKYIRKLNV